MEVNGAHQLLSYLLCVEDLKNEVYYSIAVARHTKHLGFTGVRMNPEHSNLKSFILLLVTTHS